MGHGHSNKIVIDPCQVIAQDNAPGFDTEHVGGLASPRDAHIHRWRLAEPNGPTSVGNCLVCGDVRAFTNTPADTYLDFAERAWNRRGTGAAVVSPERSITRARGWQLRGDS